MRPPAEDRATVCLTFPVTTGYSGPVKKRDPAQVPGLGMTVSRSSSSTPIQKFVASTKPVSHRPWPPRKSEMQAVFYVGNDIAYGVCRCCFGYNHSSGQCPWLSAWYQCKLLLGRIDPTTVMPQQALDKANEVYDTYLKLRGKGLSSRGAIRYGVLLINGIDLPEDKRNFLVGGLLPPRVWEVEDNELECEQPHGYEYPGVCCTPENPLSVDSDHAMLFCDPDGHVLDRQNWDSVEYLA